MFFRRFELQYNNVFKIESFLTKMSKLIYCATPGRLAQYREIIMDFVTNKGFAPFHPFQSFPFERYEGNQRVGRTKSMEYCLRAVNMCDEFWMFGISQGTLQEVVEAIKTGKPIHLHFQDWTPGDIEWKKYYTELGHKYNNPIDNLLEAV